MTGETVRLYRPLVVIHPFWVMPAPIGERSCAVMIGKRSRECPVRLVFPGSGRLIELVVMVGVGVRRAVLVVGLAWAGLLAGAASALAQPAFTQVAGSPFATGSGPASVAFSPSGGLLATANSTDGTVSVFSVAAADRGRRQARGNILHIYRSPDRFQQP